MDRRGNIERVKRRCVPAGGSVENFDGGVLGPHSCGRSGVMCARDAFRGNVLAAAWGPFTLEFPEGDRNQAAE